MIRKYGAWRTLLLRSLARLYSGPASFVMLAVFGIAMACLCSPVQGQWQQCTNNTAQPCIGSGNVGIGTTAPQATLDIFAGSGGLPSILLHNSGSGWDSSLKLMNNDNLDSLGAGAPYRHQIAAGGGESISLVVNGTDNALDIDASGKVGIGTTSPQYPLSVNGTIGASEIIVSSSGADYVFRPDYPLAPLSEVAAFINENHHLPGIPSAAEEEKSGVSLGDMQAKLLAKIEELTLHMIEAERANQELRQRVAGLERQLSAAAKAGKE